MKVLEVLNSMIGSCPVCNECIETTLYTKNYYNNFSYKLETNDYPLVFKRKLDLSAVSPCELVLDEKDEMRWRGFNDNPRTIIIDRSCPSSHYTSRVAEYHIGPDTDRYVIKINTHAIHEIVKLGKFAISNVLGETLVMEAHAAYGEYMPFNPQYKKLFSMKKTSLDKWPFDSEDSLRLKINSLLLLK